MAWYYYDNADTKQGPFTDEQIERLIEKRIIVQQTRLETGAGQQGLAEQIHRFKQKFDSLLPKNTQDSERITISLPTKKEIIDATKNISGKAKEQSGKFLKEHSPSFAVYRAYRGDQQIVIYLCGVALISVLLFCYGIIAALGILLLGIVGAGVDYLIFVNTLPAEMQGIIKDAREKELGYPEIKTAIQQYYYEQGERSVSQEEYKKAIESYEKAVKFGLTEAQHKLDDANMKLQNKLAEGNMKLQGNMNYEWGESCAAQNEYIKAISFYEKAVQCGHPEAQHKISEVKAKLTAAGKEYCEQGDNWYSKNEYEKAVECYEKSISYGNPEAQSKMDEAEAKLGEYFFEEGKKYDDKSAEALVCYQKAAGYGHTESKRKLEIITGIPPQIIVENSQQDTDTFVFRQEPDKTSLLPNSKFCPSCGTPVVTAAVICPRCGSAISGGGSGCSRVGYILLGVFLGGLGIHNFYAKRTGSAVAQLLISLLNGVIGIPLSVLTLGLFAPISIFAGLTVFIWCLIEVCTVTKDGNGQPFA